jgi:hypothetical protein
MRLPPAWLPSSRVLAFVPRGASLLAAFALAALLASGCDNELAGTEVGNPELTLSARFSIRDTDAAVSIPEMDLKVMGMGWNVGADSAACWNEAEGYMVDFAADAQDALPPVAVRDAEWTRAEVLLQSPAGNGSLPDGGGFDSWSNPRYVKLVKVMGNDTVRAAFELPADMRLRLGFSDKTIASWRKDRRMTALVRFDAGIWASGLQSAPALKFRNDGKRARYALLAPGENAAAWQALKALLPQAFMADAAEMR